MFLDEELFLKSPLVRPRNYSAFDMLNKVGPNHNNADELEIDENSAEFILSSNMIPKNYIRREYNLPNPTEISYALFLRMN